MNLLYSLKSETIREYSLKKKSARPRNIRERNSKILLDLYQAHQIVSVTQIAKFAQVSRTTVLNINEFLLNNQIILPEGKGESTTEGGKKPKIYRFNPDYGYVISCFIDLGDLYLSAFNMNIQSQFERVIPIAHSISIENIIEEIRSFLFLCEQKFDQRLPIAIVIALHGAVDTERGVCLRAIHFPSWGFESPIKDIAIKTLGKDIPIYLDSWIHYNVHAEKAMGGAQGVNSLMIINAGKYGVTSGSIIQNRLYSGEHYLAGKIGHIIVAPGDQNVCECGGYGCLESMTSIERLLDRVKGQKSIFPDSLLFRDDYQITFSDIVYAFSQDDELANKLIEEISGWFALAITNVNLILDPKLIIFEGDYAQLGEKFLEMIQSKIVNLSRLGLKESPLIILSECSQKKTLIGEAVFAKEQHFDALIHGR